MSVSNNVQIEALSWQGKKVVVFGAGLAGESALKRLIPSCKVLALLDNDPLKSGGEIQDVPIFHPTEFFNAENEVDFVLIASEFFEKISAQLIHVFQVPKEKIVVLPTVFTKPQLLGDSLDTKKLAYELVAIVASCFARQDVGYYFDAGTLLGIYRDRQLIPWDDDIDIAINSKDLDAVKKVLAIVKDRFQERCGELLAVEMLFASKNFGAVKKGDVRGLKMKSLNPESNIPMMDVFVKYVRGDEMDYVLASRGFTMPSLHLLQLQKVQFEGADVMLPSNPDDYLRLHYGDDWKTPKREWNLSMLQNTTVF